MGIFVPILNSPSLALGTSLTLFGTLQLIMFWQIWAIVSLGIKSIEDTDGELLFPEKFRGTGKVLDQSVAGRMTQMLEQTIESGTGKNARLNRLTRKTGTSQSLRDAWLLVYIKNNCWSLVLVTTMIHL